MSVDWSQFRDGDRVRVTFEGVWDAGDALRFDGDGNLYLYQPGYLTHATSAELIERPFTPPAAGKLFRCGPADDLYISDGSRYRCVRWRGRAATDNESQWFPWSAAIPSWRASIEVIDGV